jgi:hypothetical protein
MLLASTATQIDVPMITSQMTATPAMIQTSLQCLAALGD